MPYMVSNLKSKDLSYSIASNSVKLLPVITKSSVSFSVTCNAVHSSNNCLSLECSFLLSSRSSIGYCKSNKIMKNQFLNVP